MKLGSVAALCVCALLAVFALVKIADCVRTKDALTLELVQVLFRHGERTPQSNEIKLIPEATAELAEPWGFAQLTNNGKVQEYNIGRLLRREYGDFLGESFRPEYVFAQSTAYDRTKASLELVLASLYPPSAELLWSDSLRWLPIPIHSLPKQLDNLLLMSNCPRHAKLWYELIKSPEMEKLFSRYNKLYKYLRHYFPDIKFDVEQLFYLNNLITIYKTLNMTTPVWYSPEVHSQITEAAKLYLDTLSYTPELIRLNGGPLTRRMLENMDVKNATKKNPRRIYLYSGHEYTVYALAKAHNLTLDKSPAYGSAFVLEKLRDDEGQLFVKMNYWNGATEEYKPIELDGCPKICPIDKYLNIVRPYLTTDDEMLCLYKNLQPTDLEKILRLDEISKA